MQAYDLDALREVAVKVHQLAPGWGEARRASYVKHAVRAPEAQLCTPFRAALAVWAPVAVRKCQASLKDCVATVCPPAHVDSRRCRLVFVTCFSRELAQHVSCFPRVLLEKACVGKHANARVTKLSPQQHVPRQVREYGIHRTLRHASIVALTDLFEIDAAAFATVLELCPGGDLDAHLQRHQARNSVPLLALLGHLTDA